MARKFYYRAMIRISLAFENWFHFLMLQGLILCVMLTIFDAIDVWGILYASIIIFGAIIPSVIFWKVQSYFLRGFRSSLLLVLLLLLAYPLWVLVGAFGTKAQDMPIYLKLEPVTIGVFAVISGTLIAWKSWMRVNFVATKNLTTEGVAKAFLNLPENIQKNPKVFAAYTSLARISWLFANSEFSLVISTVGGSIESLLRAIYLEKEKGVVTMVTGLDINVSYETVSADDHSPFDVTYFWRSVRSKYAHSIGLETVGIKQAFLLNVLREPSEEIAEKSIGLLSVFLASYSECCKKLSSSYLE